MYAILRSTSAEQFGHLAFACALAAPCVLFLSFQPAESMAAGVLAWWASLCLISIVNIDLWRRSAAVVARRQADIDPELYRFQRWQLFLSAAYVFGCAFRSMLPRADVQRFGLFDMWISSVFVGRSVATVAELCFAAQWALVLYGLARDANSRSGLAIAKLLVPLIVVAECCSWYGVLTTSYIGNAIEESIWAIAAVLLLVGLFTSRHGCKPSARAFLSLLLLAGLAYVVYMVAVDVPMYLSRWQADEAVGRDYLSLSQGLWDVSARWTITHSWEEWHPEIPWMTLYFSFGVWCSLALVHLPRFDPRAK